MSPFNAISATGKGNQGTTISNFLENSTTAESKDAPQSTQLPDDSQALKSQPSNERDEVSPKQ